MIFLWNNVWEEFIVNYIITKSFGQKINSNIKSHENQFCWIMYGGELTINYMLVESFTQKIDSNLKPHWNHFCVEQCTRNIDN
jgi:hypothetical protein